ncbi:MAG TPA: acyltransferase [Stellaceae bacterium]|jgi:peptidoglycan/LPS O-acetylase OafA/YrhL|nr:acyltransferase [Stellaceae bacterium]
MAVAADRRAADARANNFDAIRLFAALSVVFSHSFLIAEGSEANEPFAALSRNQCVLGLVGVFVFFVISGYLVTESYCRQPAPGRFALRRALRIYPGLVVNGVVCALVIGPLLTALPLYTYFSAAGMRVFLGKILTLDAGPMRLPGVLFSDNAVAPLVNGSLWTLRYEAMMYLMIVLLGMARLLRLSTALLLIGIGIAAVYFEQALTPFGDIGEWAWLVGFFASGMAMHFLRDRVSFDGRLALAALGALVLFTWAGRLIMLFPLVGGYLVIYLARRYDRWLDYSRHLGDLSYGVYIYGWPAEQLIMRLSGGQAAWWQVFFGALAIALPAAWLSWHGVEKWALHWRRRPAAAPRAAHANRLAPAPGE